MAGVNLSVAIMGHPRREHFIRELALQLPAAAVVLDRHDNRWDTGRRAMLAHDPGADYHLVVQDDAILCRDFIPGVQKMLAQVPQVPVSLYTGRARPRRAEVTEAVSRARAAGRPFLAMQGPLWGVAVAVPVPLVEAMVEDCDRRPIRNYDLRIAAHFVDQGIPCWYTIPSLVNHRIGPENPSLVPGRGAGLSRTAHHWIGDRSPLKVNWAQGALEITGHRTLALPTGKRPLARYAPHRRRARMAQKRIADRRIYGQNAKGMTVLVAAPGQPIPDGFEVEERPRPQAEPALVTTKSERKPRKRAARPKAKK